MSAEKKNNNNYKFKDLKVYGSSEWLANGQRKYRRVYDRAETTYIYSELSFYNKKFDEEEWDINIVLKAHAINDGKKRELCDLPIEKRVDKDTNIVYIYQAWGNKRLGFYWKKGEYEWSAYLNDELVATTKFWVEDNGLVTEDHNPYFNIDSLKLYEGPNTNVEVEERNFYKVFDSKQTRYIFIDFVFENLVSSSPWQCELGFKFYNDAHQLKGETVELITVEPTDKTKTITSGWGSNDKGTWFLDKYTLEITFMDQLIAVLPFEVSDRFEEGMNEALLPNTGITITTAPKEESQSFEEVMADLEGLVGLQHVKTRIKEFAEYLKFIKIRLEKGFEDAHNINLHAVFTGNPGTGKTTVATMLGQIYKQLGLLSKGHVHSVDRADLVGEYIGQTAPKVKEAIKKARGGILFIDEAYSLSRSKDDVKDFGREVIEILIKEMSDGEGDLSVVVAGYPREMKTFINTNPGLKSRFTHWFEFSDYYPHELLDISEYAADNRKVIFSPQAKAFLYDRIVEAYRTRDRYFGNARFIYNTIDKAKINLGLRVMKNENPRKLSREELSLITVDDLETVFQKKKKNLADIPINEKMLEEALAELNAMIGLKNVKESINNLVQLIRFYREMGKDVLNKFSLHTVFTGNPGTGKTTVARVLAKIYKALGILERGHLVECDRQSLVAGFVGQTAIKTTAKIDEAVGGVLFIDEAYALTNSRGGDYGNEAIAAILKRMEDQKGEFAIVVAGYPKEMGQFIESNPGLKSRFDRTIQFDDFEENELTEIAQFILKKEGYTIAKEAQEQLSFYFDMASRSNFFGNARTVVKTIEQVIETQNLRVALVPKEERTVELLQHIELADVKDFNEEKAYAIGGKSLGFSHRAKRGSAAN